MTDRVLLLLSCSVRAIALVALTGLMACTDQADPVGSVDGGTPDGDCEVGALGCECASGDVCGTDLRGSALRCQEGICVSPDCVAGATGCVCLGGTRCDTPGDVCLDGVCKAEDCTAGTLHCSCVAGTCDAGLHCDEGLGGGTCVDGAGYAGGACLPNRLCYGANRCDAQLSVCVPCEPGSQACIPIDGVVCNAGLIAYAGHCLAPIDVPPSEDERVCRTRCRDDYDAPGDHRACIDGFIDGCVGELECVDGSCVVPGDDPRTCESQTDCPDFQRCFANGRCYSECNTNVDCVDGYACYRHACRIPCQATTATSSACPSGMHCDTRDGSSGVCMPLPEPTSDGPTPVLGSFTIAPEHLALGALTPSGTVSLAVESAKDETFEIVKVSERVYDASGDEVSDPLGASDPLDFVQLSVPGATETAEGHLSVTAPARCGDACPTLTVTVTGAPNIADWSRWEGELEVRHATLGTERIRLGYQASADGRWTGSMHYFASFPKENLSEWRDGLVPAQQVANGLIRAWGTFRRGRLPGGADALSALLLATSQESWRWPTVQRACADAYKTDDEVSYPGACFLFDNGSSGSTAREYVEDLTVAPLPTGATELPLALDVRMQTGADGLPELSGFIDSGIALHYPGSPAVRIAFEASPVDVGSCDPSNATDCVVYLDAFDADIRVGARMPLADDGSCEDGFDVASVPWLLADFVGPSDGLSVGGCLDHRAPFPALSADNTNLSRANPFADGRPVVRELRLMDGALINQRQLVVLFEERFSSSLHPEGFSAYGYILLEHADTLVPDTVFDAAEAAQTLADTTTPDPARPPLGPTCDPAWLQEILGADFALPDGISTDPVQAQTDRELIGEVVQVMYTGRTSDTATIDYPDANIHVLCVDNGLIDGGPDPDAPKPCPATSRVRYFYLPDAYNERVDIPALDCQADSDPGDGVYRGRCGDKLQDWATSVYGIVLDPLWRCADPDDAYCPTDPSAPKAGKIFYEATAPTFVPLLPAIQEAFRYKTQFMSPTGHQVGFAPVACVGSGSQTPYCYDPVAIEEIIARIDCLLAMYDRYAAAEKSRPEWDELRAFLSASLSYDGVIEGNGMGLVADGFERLYAELLIMLGDEAFTEALSSRFDLAATREAPFLGSRFEANGVNLSGIAGFEMRSLYRAAQYYELATERFFSRIAPVIRTALAHGDRGASGDAIVTQGLVTTYMERLIGGSTKRAKTYAEIATRYQSLNRPDLAEAVLARGYTSTYLESITLSNLMLGVAELSSSARDQVIAEIEDAQTRYQVALHEMREVLSSVHDGVDQFGHTPDYVPFPAIDDNDVRYANAFETELGLARFRLETARYFEDAAISSNREFETDSASFQQELVQIARSFEDRLLSLCGSFRGRDGLVYPAIAKYAPLSDATAAMSTSPCGRVGNGEIYQQLGQLQLLDDERRQVDKHLQNVLAEVADARARATAQCGRIDHFIDEWTTIDNQRIRLQDTIDGMQNAVSLADRTFNVISQSAQAGFGGVGVAAAGAGYVIGASLLEVDISIAQHQLQKTEQQLQNLQMNQECPALQIDTFYQVRSLLRESIEVQLEALHLAHRASLAVSELDRLYLEAQRTEQRERESEELAIDVEAARNDPNIRVYRNAAVINADETFRRALDHAYRVTRMYEYYTSQTYAGRGDLYLIRMVQRGVPNLVSYLDRIEDDYEAFRVQFRTVAHRVRRISLLNDIFQVPYQKEGRELSEEERFQIMRERLRDPSRIDANGRRVVEFRTFAEQTAPCTFNHQIDFIEIDLIGQNLGDEFANLLLWQDGTGVIESLAGGQVDYQLSPLLVVAQPHFNNSQRFDPSIYRRFELRERPFVNTSWKLVFDQHNDPDNRDISIDGLKDIHIYVHYTDFTNSGACR